MLASDTLRVVLVTTHIPLRDVPAAVTPTAIADAAAVTRDGLRQWFGIAEPRIALCGMNPHLGDGGRFGTEDDAVLAPAARAAGIAGPLAADTVFVRGMRGEFDAVIACYHDQGLIPVKLIAFGRAVNVTLGLPIIRTSVDHGTAFDIAGQGVADPSSLRAALVMARQLAARSTAATCSVVALSALLMMTACLNPTRSSPSRRMRTGAPSGSASSSARTAGIFSIRLELRASNDAARYFYERLGYREAGVDRKSVV